MTPARRGRGPTNAVLPAGLYETKGTDGRICYYSRVRGEAGRVDRRIPRGADRAQAIEAHLRLRAQKSREPWTEVRDAWREWLALDIGQKWKPKNARTVEQRFVAYVDPLLGRKRVCDLSGDDSRRLAKRLAEHGLSGQTQAHMLTHWARFGRWLESERFVPRTPVLSGLRPTIPASIPDPLTEEELGQLEGIAERYRFAVRLILATGLRWSDTVRLEARHLSVDGWLTVACSKTGKRLRIPLGETDPELAAEIRQRVGRLVPFGAGSVSSFNRRVKGHSGLERFSTYRLRDTFACTWLEHGGSITDLQQILGHASPETTQRYGRPSDERIRAEAQRITAARRARRLGRESVR